MEGQQIVVSTGGTGLPLLAPLGTADMTVFVGISYCLDPSAAPERPTGKTTTILLVHDDKASEDGQPGTGGKDKYDFVGP